MYTVSMNGNNVCRFSSFVAALRFKKRVISAYVGTIVKIIKDNK